jgi:hypothetical protein
VWLIAWLIAWRVRLHIKGWCCLARDLTMLDKVAKPMTDIIIDGYVDCLSSGGLTYFQLSENQPSRRRISLLVIPSLLSAVTSRI